MGLPQLADLAFQRLDALAPLAGGAGSLATVALGLLHSTAQRLACAANLGSDRADRSPLRGVITLLLAHQANRSLTYLRRKSPLSRGGHHHSLLKLEASNKLGAVQLPSEGPHYQLNRIGPGTAAQPCNVSAHLGEIQPRLATAVGGAETFDRGRELL